jgi:hypothetical protein
MRKARNFPRWVRAPRLERLTVADCGIYGTGTSSTSTDPGLS